MMQRQSVLVAIAVIGLMFLVAGPVLAQDAKPQQKIQIVPEGGQAQAEARAEVTVTVDVPPACGPAACEPVSCCAPVCCKPICCRPICCKRVCRPIRCCKPRMWRCCKPCCCCW